MGMVLIVIDGFTMHSDDGIGEKERLVVLVPVLEIMKILKVVLSWSCLKITGKQINRGRHGNGKANWDSGSCLPKVTHRNRNIWLEIRTANILCNISPAL